MATPQQTPTPAPTPTSPSEQEYTHLISFHERLINKVLVAMSLLVALAAFLFFKDLNSVKTSAEAQIQQVQRDAANIATTEAQKRVEQAFEQNNVQALIEHTAKTKVDAAVDRAISQNLEKRIDAMENEIAETSEVSNEGSRLRIGLRSGLDALIVKAKSPNPHIAQYAKSTLAVIAADYERSLLEDTNVGVNRTNLNVTRFAFRADDLLVAHANHLADRHLVRAIRHL